MRTAKLKAMSTSRSTPLVLTGIHRVEALRRRGLELEAELRVVTAQLEAEAMVAGVLVSRDPDGQTAQQPPR